MELNGTPKSSSGFSSTWTQGAGRRAGGGGYATPPLLGVGVG
ncbi:hypothetical protein ACE4RV_04270 [Acetobacter persici]